MWPHTEDCQKYYLCRSISTSWGEKKEEICYPGSYFDRALGQCKWVGDGNYDCKEILEKNAEIENAINGKIDKTETNDLNSAEPSVIPESKYTCRTDTDEEDYESNPDYAKCFTCEAEIDNPEKCNSKPNNQTSDTVWCNIRNKKCFSKAVFKKSTNQLESFSRGCASVNELSKNKITQTVTNNRAVCIRDSGKSKTCFVLCDSSMCNSITEIKSAAFRMNLNCLNYLTFILFLFFL
jgi:hypothetical protein